MKKKIVVLSGAGISAESGIKTFRDADGLWEGHDIYEVASPQGFKQNPKLVLDFYNQRRAQLKSVLPNLAHQILVELEEDFDVTIITQNVDDLHERAGSSSIIHLHGELMKVRSVVDDNYIVDWKDNLYLGDLDPKGHQLRPHIVWFGEAVPKLEVSIPYLINADIILIIGTSMQVYPAAGLVAYANPISKIYYIDPQPSINYELAGLEQLEIIEQNATEGMVIFRDKIKKG